MNSSEFCPTDERTGLALPLIPRSIKQLSPKETDHHLLHPARSGLLNTQHGKAFRLCWVQTNLSNSIHKRDHTLVESGELSYPLIPDDVMQMFTMGVIACSGYLPPYGVNTDTGKVEAIEQETYLSMVARGDVGIDAKRSNARARIGRFFASVATSQNATETVSGKVIDEFVFSQTNNERKKELGNFILAECIGHALDSVVPLHRALLSEGLVHPGKQCSARGIVKKFFQKQYFPDYHDVIASNLRLKIDAA